MRLWRNQRGRFRNVARLKTILGVLASHGFHGLVARVKLGRFVIDRLISKDLEHLSAPERVRMAFEQLGPTFVKLGQLLATRPDLIPIEFSQEFRKLHDQVGGVPFPEIDAILSGHFGAPLSEIFAGFDETPLAAASIAQVHRARLKDGSSVVVKVQRPGIERVIHDDLQILRALAELADRYIPEVRVFNPRGIIEEFGRSLEMETNFIIEANNVRRFAANFAGDPYIKIPQVYTEYTGRRVLVLEALDGIPLSQGGALKQDGVDPEEILKRGLRAYMKMVYSDGLFHGDLHAGNVLLLPGNKIGLIDFGQVGRLNRKTQNAIANMFLALADEDYDRMAYLYVDLAPFTERVDLDQFSRDIRDLIAPYFGLTMKNVNLGRLLMDSTAVAARHGLTLPSELVVFFKSIVALEGMGRMILKDFDFLTYSLEFAKELVLVRLEPQRMFSNASVLARDMNSLISALPRQLKQVLRRLNDPDFSLQTRSKDLADLRKSVDRAAWVIFWGLIFAAAVLGLILRYARP
jgi:ubiquinone biosynthesis protein